VITKKKLMRDDLVQSQIAKQATIPILVGSGEWFSLGLGSRCDVSEMSLT
jgi:hypothetical protein